jgi:hypothetical protein
MNENLDFDYIDFEVKKEPWNLYKIEDGSLIKFKLVLVRVMPNKSDPKKYLLNTANVIGVQSPRELRGAPAPPSANGTYDDLEKKDLDFEVIKENWSEYKLKDGNTLRIKSVIISIDKTKSFGDNGEPIYAVHNQILKKEP